jgi:hypothetical protein
LAEKNKTYDRELHDLSEWVQHFGVEDTKTNLWREINGDDNLTGVIDTVDKEMESLLQNSNRYYEGMIAGIQQKKLDEVSKVKQLEQEKLYDAKMEVVPYEE